MKISFRKDRDATLQKRRCPYCREDTEDNDYDCPSCSTTMHLECWKEAKQCPTIGCPHKFSGIEKLVIRKIARKVALSEDLMAGWSIDFADNARDFEAADCADPELFRVLCELGFDKVWSLQISFDKLPNKFYFKAKGTTNSTGQRVISIRVVGHRERKVFFVGFLGDLNFYSLLNDGTLFVSNEQFIDRKKFRSGVPDVLRNCEIKHHFRPDSRRKQYLFSLYPSFQSHEYKTVVDSEDGEFYRPLAPWTKAKHYETIVSTMFRFHSQSINSELKDGVEALVFESPGPLFQRIVVGLNRLMIIPKSCLGIFMLIVFLMITLFIVLNFFVSI